MILLTRNWARLAVFVATSLFVLTTVPPHIVAQVTDKTNAHSKSADKIDFSQPLTISWRYDSNFTLNLTPAFDTERIYLPLAGGTVVSLMGGSGQLNWRSEMGGELSASPVADERAVYVASETSNLETGTRRATGAVRALGREGGVTQWMRTLAMPLRGGLTLGNGVLIGGSSDGKIYAFDSTNGEARWSYDYGAPFNSQPVVSESRVYIGSEDGNLLALDEATGKLLWHYRTKGAVRGAVANGNDIVYFGSGDGYVYAANATNGRLIWRKRTGAGVAAVVRTSEELLVASLDNFVYKYSLAGARLWRRRLPGRISSQPLIRQRAALFMPFSSSAGVVLELRDGRQINLLPTGEEIATSASPIAVGEVVLLTTEHGLLAFAQPQAPPQK
ncbi:MAG TPA: PQQ-binding-like beta-propeller repeat protein [Pyrinomonadaceae bacterium]|jgi:outer membrane protein assembly factor BamB|nr:PQQ-binding-like beta-propeller repeat protein [Pyrinomonadaceae bacterium]